MFLREKKKSRLSSFLSGNMKQSMIVLLLSSITAVVAGLFLGKEKETLLLLPGLIILLPGSIDMRGALFAALGSRLSSDMHLGLISKFRLKNKIIRDNIYASLAMSFVLSIALGAFAYSFSVVLGLESMTIYSFIVIAVIAALISGAVLLVITFIISFKAFKRGWDPDNITAPLISTFGDFFTIPALLLAANFVLYLEGFFVMEIAIALILIALMLVFIMLIKKSGCKRIVFEASPILFLTAVISAVSGIFIEPNIDTFVLFASLLVLLPAFIGQCGNIGNILASRISTRLHMGTIKVGFKFNKNTRNEIISTYILCLFIFPFIAFISFLFSIILGISTISLLHMVIITTMAGLGVVSILIFVSFAMAIVSYKFNMDPDNVIIPVVSALGDIIGVLFFLGVLLLFGII